MVTETVAQVSFNLHYVKYTNFSFYVQELVGSYNSATYKKIITLIGMTKVFKTNNVRI